MTAPIDWNDEPGQAEIEGAAEQQDEHFTALHGPDWPARTRPDADPSVADWREATGLSTSAQLRAENETLARKWEAALSEGDEQATRIYSLRAELAKTQAALAASQADLTAALAKRDELVYRVGKLETAWRLAKNSREFNRANLVEEKRLHARTVAQATIDGAELASARKELEHRRNLGVELEKLRDIVHRCSACSAALRGEEER